jgi:hypothetical protein
MRTRVCVIQGRLAETEPHRTSAIEAAGMIVLTDSLMATMSQVMKRCKTLRGIPQSHLACRELEICDRCCL